MSVGDSDFKIVVLAAPVVSEDASKIELAPASPPAPAFGRADRGEVGLWPEQACSPPALHPSLVLGRRPGLLPFRQYP